MTPRTYQVASRQLLRQAKEELAAGDVHQASENGWGAVPTSAACCPGLSVPSLRNGKYALSGALSGWFEPWMTCESSKGLNRCHSSYLYPLWRFLRKIG